MSKQVAPKKPIKHITIEDLYHECRLHDGYFETLISENKKDNLEGVLRDDGFDLSEKDYKSLKEKLRNKKMTDIAAGWLKLDLRWEESREAERKRRKDAKRKAGGGGEKGPEDENCHWDDTV